MLVNGHSLLNRRVKRLTSLQLQFALRQVIIMRADDTNACRLRLLGWLICSLTILLNGHKLRLLLFNISHSNLPTRPFTPNLSVYTHSSFVCWTAKQNVQIIIITLLFLLNGELSFSPLPVICHTASLTRYATSCYLHNALQNMFAAVRKRWTR